MQPPSDRTVRLRAGSHAGRNRAPSAERTVTADQARRMKAASSGDSPEPRTSTVGTPPAPATASPPAKRQASR